MGAMMASIAAFGVSVPPAARRATNSSASVASGADEALAPNPNRGMAGGAEAAFEDAVDGSAWGAGEAGDSGSRGATVGKIPGTLNWTLSPFCGFQWYLDHRPIGRQTKYSWP